MVWSDLDAPEVLTLGLGDLVWYWFSVSKPILLKCTCLNTFNTVSLSQLQQVE